MPARSPDWTAEKQKIPALPVAEAPDPLRASNLVVQDDAQEAVIDRQAAAVAVIDKAMLSELIHEVTDSQPGSAHHFRQITLTDTWNLSFRSALLAEIGKQQEDPCQPLFT